MPGPEIHGTLATRGTAVLEDHENHNELTLDYSEIGASFAGKLISGELEFQGAIPEAGESPFHVSQAYLQVGQSDYSLKFGLQDTHFGYEPINPADSPFVSRSWLYSTGPVSTMEASVSGGNKTVQFTAGVNTSNWDGLSDNFSLPALYTGLSLSLGDLSVLTNLGAGPESGDENFRTLIDIVATYDPSKSIHLGLNYDYAINQNGPDTNTWQGADLYLVVKPDGDPFQWGNRLEVFRDADGFISGESNLFVMGLTTSLDVDLAAISSLPTGFKARGEINQQIGLNDATSDPTIFGVMLLYSGTYKDSSSD